MNKMTVEQLRNAVCARQAIVRECNIALQSTQDRFGKSRIDLTNLLCSYGAVKSFPVDELLYDDGKFIALIDIPEAALLGLRDDY